MYSPMSIAPLCISHHSASGAWLMVSAEQGVPETLGPTQGLLCKHASAFSIPKRIFLRQRTYQRLVVQTFIVNRFYLNGSSTAPSLSSCSRSVTHLIIAFRTPKVVSRFTYSSRASKTHSTHQQGRLEPIHHTQSPITIVVARCFSRMDPL
jgi:hypothetical protein